MLPVQRLNYSGGRDLVCPLLWEFRWQVGHFFLITPSLPNPQHLIRSVLFRFFVVLTFLLALAWAFVLVCLIIFFIRWGIRSFSPTRINGPALSVGRLEYSSDIFLGSYLELLDDHFDLLFKASRHNFCRFRLIPR